MGSSCKLYADCINPKGEVVESKLFKDLLHYTSDNRKLTLQYYAVGKDKYFLDEVRSKAIFDENGEITFQSLKKLASLNIEEDTKLQVLNKDLGTGEYSYDDGMAKLQKFNKESSYNDEYLATVSPLENGKFKISVVKRTKETEEKLNNFVRDRNLVERIKYFLAKAGVEVGFLDSESNLDGRYSTYNAVKNADGLYQLIKVAHNEKLTESLAEEAGHFAVGALGNSPLVQRLIQLMSPEVQNKIMSENPSKAVGTNSARELAGALVGKAIAGNIDNKTEGALLAKRIVNLAKKVFFFLTQNDIANAKLQATAIAEQIAKGFMSPNFTGDVEQAIEIKEVLYSNVDSFNVKKLKELTTLLKAQALRMRNINDKLYREYTSLANLADSKLISAESQNSVRDMFALEGITELVSHLTDMMQGSIISKLNSVDFDNIADFNSKLSEHGKTLREIRVFTKTCLKVIDVIGYATRPDKNGECFSSDARNVSMVENGKDVTYDLIAEVTRLQDLFKTVTTGLFYDLRTKEDQYYLHFLTDIFGQDSIVLDARVVFRNKHNKDKGGRNKGFITFLPKEKLEVKDMLSHLDSDITYFERFIAAMGNSSDLIHQILDKSRKESKMQSDALSFQMLNRLRVLQKRAEALGITDTAIFAEKSSTTGKITGNFISEYNYDDYEQAQLAFSKTLEEKFKKEYPDVSNLSSFDIDILQENFYKKEYKIWHMGDDKNLANSRYDSINKKYIPSAKYLNEVYLTTIKGTPKEEILNEFRQIKEELDNYLPTGSAISYRLPQFRGRTINRIQNKGLYENAGLATIGVVKQQMHETFAVNSEDTDYGSLATYNLKNERLYVDMLAFEADQINRIPLHGINKLKDTSELSTDLYHSLFAYAGMAYDHSALSQIVDAVEIGSEVLLRRKIGESDFTEEESTGKNKSRSYNRQEKWKQKQIYGKRLKASAAVRVLDKIVKFVSSQASRLMLGGNLAGGLTNLLTGNVEIFKEAITAEDFNGTNLYNAIHIYNKYLPGTAIDALTGLQISDNKLGLFAQIYDISGKNNQNQRAWYAQQSRVATATNIDDLLFMPYSAGGHFMETIPFLAIADKTKLIDKNGNKISLFNAYKVVSLTKGVHTIVLTNDAKEYSLLKGLSSKIQKSIKDNISLNNSDLTAEEQQYKSDNSNLNLFELDEKIKKDLIENTTFYKSAIDKHTAGVINSIIDKIEKFEKDFNLTEKTNDFTDEEQKFIKDRNYNLAFPENVVTSLKNEYKKSVWTKADDTSYGMKSRESANRMHGIYNDLDKAAITQTVLGNMMSVMKGYAYGLLEKNVSQLKYSIALGRMSEGVVSTGSKVFLDVVSSLFSPENISDLKTAQFWSMFWPFAAKTRQHMVERGYLIEQANNMRRLITQHITLMILGLLLKISAKPPEEEEEDTLTPFQRKTLGMNSTPTDYSYSLWGVTHYFLNRLIKEQAAYSIPLPFMVEAKSLLSISPAAISGLVMVYDAMYATGGAMITSEDNAEFYYQINRKGKFKEGDPKFKNKLKKLTPFLKNLPVIENGYQATENFNYVYTLRR